MPGVLPADLRAVRGEPQRGRAGAATGRVLTKSARNKISRNFRVSGRILFDEIRFSPELRHKN
jgi:hypothetical protein